MAVAKLPELLAELRRLAELRCDSSRLLEEMVTELDSSDETETVEQFSSAFKELLSEAGEARTDMSRAVESRAEAEQVKKSLTDQVALVIAENEELTKTLEKLQNDGATATSSSSVLNSIANRVEFYKELLCFEMRELKNDRTQLVFYRMGAQRNKTIGIVVDSDFQLESCSLVRYSERLRPLLTRLAETGDWRSCQLAIRRLFRKA